ncbi:hypothetical protein J3E69DRAFT_333670 [Trichoderma sp. SZMC 28015]
MYSASIPITRRPARSHHFITAVSPLSPKFRPIHPGPSSPLSEMQSQLQNRTKRVHTKQAAMLCRIRCHVTSLLYQVSLNAFHSCFFFSLLSKSK